MQRQIYSRLFTHSFVPRHLPNAIFKATAILSPFLPMSVPEPHSGTAQKKTIATNNAGVQSVNCKPSKLREYITKTTTVRTWETEETCRCRRSKNRRSSGEKKKTTTKSKKKTSQTELTMVIYRHRTPNNCTPNGLESAQRSQSASQPGKPVSSDRFPSPVRWSSVLQGVLPVDSLAQRGARAFRS